MKPQHLEICLYQPEIPQNTGNIARLAAATGCRLSLVEPFGFGTSDKNLRRPGLDYWPYLDLEIHRDFTALKERHAGQIAYLSTKAEKPYSMMPPSVQLLVFGPETRGLPEDMLHESPDEFYRIPMFHDKVRSLNLANAVAIVLYHQLMMRKIF